MRRRPLLLTLPLLALPRFAAGLPPRPLVFPRDHGSHPEHRTEWWYITGQVRSGTRDFGFQLTFFRSRVEAAQAMQSRFAARQLLFAHAAVTDLQGRRLWHDQRVARVGFGVATAAEYDTRLRLRDWSLERDAASGAYVARLPALDFGLDLRCTPTQPLVLQGAAGLSRKGPATEQASYYYSQPQLSVTGRLRVQERDFEIAGGKAWMDHEVSDALMHPDAVGWDWIGMNLDDGSALTAFRLRRKDGTTLWAGGSFRGRGSDVRAFQPGEVVFTPVRYWKSAATQTTYPVEWSVRTPVATYTVSPLLDAQELDSRGSTGAIYWEGLCALLDGQGRRVGGGYLELTGYGQPLRL